MSEQSLFYFLRISHAATIGNVEVSNHSFAAFIDEKGVAEIRPRSTAA